ncbi:SseB family protein [Nocardioides sp. HM23]|uniref:SseB family protein n=1 Tax=Nocardioides bizhenqiangii TaxID=3095076 RepID=UPI002ACAD6CE|nr:SseB family protein [Nocardioides sp. HM23]MDZ5622155.1 SseB family protein [Nocardioides sp. HM23]
MRGPDATGGTMGSVTDRHPKQRLIQGSPYVDDDGSADPALRASLRAYADGSAEYPEVLAALAGARLLVPVVALVGEVEHDAAGLAHDKSSDMATVLLTAPDGRQALLAFSGADSMRTWDPDARPVPVAAALAAATAVQEGADALVVDVGREHALTVAGEDLRRLATGGRPVRLPDDGWAWALADPGIRPPGNNSGNILR